jgi:hypothetical protein
MPSEQIASFYVRGVQHRSILAPAAERQAPKQRLVSSPLAPKGVQSSTLCTPSGYFLTAPLYVLTRRDTLRKDRKSAGDVTQIDQAAVGFDSEHVDGSTCRVQGIEKPAIFCGG